MTDPRITDKAVEAAAKAACETAYPPKSHKPWDEVEDWEQDAWRATTRAALEAALPHHLTPQPLLAREAVEEAIATKVMYYDSGTAVHEVDDSDLAGLIAGTDAVMELAQPTPAYSEIKAAIRTGLGGNTEEGCGCESHICSAADAVLALINGSAS